MFVTRIYLILSLLLLAGNGKAQRTITKSARPAIDNATYKKNSVNNTLLWEISGKGLKKPSYLFGTMHILCADDAQLSTGLKNIIKNSDVVYLELDMDNKEEILGAVEYLRMTDGTKLSDLLTKEEFARVENYFKTSKFPLPVFMLNRFKPYLVTALIGEQLMDCEKKNGMEERIMEETKLYSREIKGLETMKFQAGLFDSIPYEKQAKELMQYIDSLDNYRKVNQQMVDAYKTQNLEYMDELIHKSDPGLEEYLDLLVYSRNRNWVKQIPEIINNQSVLFAVGAGHLPGKQGVISLLRKQGYTVKPLKN
ncbi:MAG: TraB/GumN family protein [Chitinophagaceae bacterium]